MGKFYMETRINKLLNFFQRLGKAVMTSIAVLTGAALDITAFFGVIHGYSFSAGLIDYLLNLNLAEKSVELLLVGIIIGIVYFIIFYFFNNKIWFKNS